MHGNGKKATLDSSTNTTASGLETLTHTPGDLAHLRGRLGALPAELPRQEPQVLGLPGPLLQVIAPAQPSSGPGVRVGPH